MAFVEKLGLTLEQHGTIPGPTTLTWTFPGGIGVESQYKVNRQGKLVDEETRWGTFGS